jgi:hypothetical protein
MHLWSPILAEVLDEDLADMEAELAYWTEVFTAAPNDFGNEHPSDPRCVLPLHRQSLTNRQPVYVGSARTWNFSLQGESRAPTRAPIPQRARGLSRTPLINSCCVCTEAFCIGAKIKPYRTRSHCSTPQWVFTGHDGEVRIQASVLTC